MFIAKETGSDKWIAPKTSSGFSSNRSDARRFDDYNSLLRLLSNDKRYAGVKFACTELTYLGKDATERQQNGAGKIKLW